jgi:hypothetical protein
MQYQQAATLPVVQSPELPLLPLALLELHVQ